VDCHYEAFPTIEAPTLDGRELRQGVLEIGEPEINQMIERLRRDAGHYHVVERAAQKNDQLQVNLQVWHDDELVGENAKRQWILGSPMLHGEITTTLSGIVKGETRDIRIKHDDNHPNEKMRGIEERLTVTVEEISELHMPEQNEEFFSRFGVTEGGEEAFRQLVDTRLHSEVKQRLNDYGREQTMNLLIQATPKFALPQSLVRAEMSNMYQQLQQNVKKQNLPIPPDALQNIYMQATRRVTLGLIMAEWQRRENQQVTEEEVNAILEEMADTYEDSQTFKTHAQQNARFMEGLRLSALEKKAVQWIQDRVTVVEEPLTLGQLLGDVEEESPDDEKVSSTAEA
jgi:trigger factor